MKKKLMTNSLRENLWGWLFVSLWVVGFLVFTCYPLIRTFALSFDQVTITAEGIVTESVGGDNYRNALLSDPVFTDALIGFVGELLLDVPIVIVFSLVMAMILNMGLKGTGVLRTVFFLPVIIMSGPVMKKLIENGATTIQGAAENALVQNVLEMLPEQLSMILNNLLSSFIMILWFCGVQILIFLSALQKVDKPVYEAAKIDGASKWVQFWQITLPTLRPMIIVNMLYTIVSISSFELNDVIVLIQKDSFAANYGLGYASALSFIYFVVLIAIMGLFVGIYGLRSPTDRKIARETKQMVKQLEKIQQRRARKARKPV
jgi:ABC-type sugar transport system permease subunit